MEINRELADAIAAARVRARRFSIEPDPQDIQPGDIVLARSSEITRIVHVRAPSIDGMVQIQLCHPYTELATDFDLIIPAGRIAPYDLMIQGELNGVIWKHQITGRLGCISLEERQAINRAIFTDGETLDPLPHGMPLPLIPHGACWKFKEEELDELRLLVADATRWALGI